MATITRTYTFTDGTTAYGSEVESEVSNIVTVWNNHDSGASTWTLVRIANGSVGTPSLAFGGDTDTGIYTGTADNTFRIATAGTLALLCDSAQDVYTVGYTDYSATSTVTGWTSFTTKLIYYKKIGTFVYVWYNLSGTSNATNATFTLPYSASNTVTPFLIAYAVDNGGTAAAGLVTLLPNTSTVNLFKDPAANNWTNTGTKTANGHFFYQTT